MQKSRVVILDGPLAGKSVPIDAHLTIGRTPDNHLQLLDKSVSLFHAEICRKAEEWWIKDLISETGTLVNEQKVSEWHLRSGDEITIGPFHLRFIESVYLTLDFENSLEEKADAEPDAAMRSVEEIEIHEIDEASPESESVQNLAKELKKLEKRYSLLQRTTNLIRSERPPRDIYQEILLQLFSMVRAERGTILIQDSKTKDFEPVAVHFANNKRPKQQLRISRTILGRAISERVAVLSSDSQNDAQFNMAQSVILQNICSAICAPLVYKGEILGAIYLDTQKIYDVFDSDDLHLVSAVAGAAAIAIKNAMFVEELKEKNEEIQQNYLSTIRVIANSIEARDKYTIGHAWRVTRFAMALAEALNWNERKKKILEMGGVLHDVGKVGIKDGILCKNGKLSDEEYECMQLHPKIGAQILKGVPFLKPAIPYVLNHHERWDGRGYPNGLSGEAIPIEGRILAIADAFDAMTSNRIYRRGMLPEDAAREIERCTRSQFDPALAPIFLEIFRAGKIDYVLQNKAEKESRQVICPSCTTSLILEEKVHQGDCMVCLVCNRTLHLLERQGEMMAELVSMTGIYKAIDPNIE